METTYEVEIRTDREEIIIYEDARESDRLAERAIDAADLSGYDVFVVKVTVDGVGAPYRETVSRVVVRNGRSVLVGVGE